MSGMRQLDFDDYVEIFRRRWWLVTVLALVGAGAGYGLAHFLPKRYTSQTLVLVEQPTVPGDYVKPVITQDVNQRLATMQQQILSRTRLEPVIQQFGLFPEDIKQRSMEELVQRLRETISVTPIRAMTGTEGRMLPGFYIGVVFDDPHLAQQICSTITSMFMEENLKLRQQLSEQTTQFLSKQLEDAKARLDEQDSKLADFKRQHIGSLPDESNTNLNILTGLTTQLDAVTQALARGQQDKSFAESVLAQQLEAWQPSQVGPNPETREQQLSARELQLSEASVGVQETFDDVTELAARCRFSDCAHEAEPGCAVQEALVDGRLDPERWASYGDIMAGYRAWLAQVPPKIAAQIASGNARALFGSER